MQSSSEALVRAQSGPLYFRISIGDSDLVRCAYSTRRASRTSAVTAHKALLKIENK